MTRDEIELTIIDALKRASVRPIAPTAASDLVADLGLDSVQILEAVAEIEDRFDLTVPASDLTRFKTVADAAAYLEGTLAARQQAG
jgi:acyl carrier protein